MCKLFYASFAKLSFLKKTIVFLFDCGVTLKDRKLFLKSLSLFYDVLNGKSIFLNIDKMEILPIIIDGIIKYCLIWALQKLIA